MIGIAAQLPPEAATAVGGSVGVAAGSVAEAMVGVGYRLWSDRVERVKQFTESVSAEAGVPAEDVLREAMEDPRTLELFAQVAESASRALDGWKIDLLASIFVRGARDGANVDVAAMVFDAVRDLQRPHLRLLQILSEPNPNGVEGRWHAEHVMAADEGIGEAFDALISKLAAAGMATDTRTKTLVWYTGGAWTLTELGRQCVAYLAERGAQLNTKS